MPYRQQRTLSRRRFDPGQGPLPIMLKPPVAFKNGADRLTLQFWEPVVGRGVPPVEVLGLGFPVSALWVNEFIVELDYGMPVVSGSIVQLEDWSPTLRGQNGEWVPGWATVLGNNSPAGMPTVVRVVNVSADGMGGANWVLESACAIPNAELFMEIYGHAGVSSSTGDNITYNVLYATTPVTGDTWNVTPWTPDSWSVTTGAWIAGGQGYVF